MTREQGNNRSLIRLIKNVIDTPRDTSEHQPIVVAL